jgi:hypothetical protein
LCPHSNNLKLRVEKGSFSVPLFGARWVLVFPALREAMTLGALFVHPRWDVIAGLFRVDEGDCRLAQVYCHRSGMPVLNGFAFSSEEPHRDFPLS